jgi:hypothetical protein
LFTATLTSQSGDKFSTGRACIFKMPTGRRC